MYKNIVYFLFFLCLSCSEVKKVNIYEKTKEFESKYIKFIYSDTVLVKNADSVGFLDSRESLMLLSPTLNEIQVDSSLVDINNPTFLRDLDRYDSGIITFRDLVLTSYEPRKDSLHTVVFEVKTNKSLNFVSKVLIADSKLKKHRHKIRASFSDSTSYIHFYTDGCLRIDNQYYPPNTALSNIFLYHL